jgi:hypothetical protein
MLGSNIYAIALRKLVTILVLIMTLGITSWLGISYVRTKNAACRAVIEQVEQVHRQKGMVGCLIFPSCYGNHIKVIRDTDNAQEWHVTGVYYRHIGDNAFPEDPFDESSGPRQFAGNAWHTTDGWKATATDGSP